MWVGCDHAGFNLKTALIARFSNVAWRDEGSFDSTSVDYPDYAEKVAIRLKENPKDLGLLICGSGEGMVMKANRYGWIRAALCWNVESARLSRAHNDANVLCLASRLIDEETNAKILTAFLETAFEGGRHQRRVDKLK